MEQEHRTPRKRRNGEMNRNSVTVSRGNRGRMSSWLDWADNTRF